MAIRVYALSNSSVTGSGRRPGGARSGLPMLGRALSFCRLSRYYEHNGNIVEHASMPYANEVDRAAALDVLERHARALTTEAVVILIRVAYSVFTSSNLAAGQPLKERKGAC